MALKFEATQVCIYKYQDQLENLADAVTITSCVVSSVTFLLKCCDSQSFVFPGRLATQTTFLAVLFSFTLLISTATNYKQMELDANSEYEHLCTAQGIMFQFIAVALTIHWVFIGLVTYLVVVVRYPVRSFVRVEFYFHVFCWFSAIFLTFFPILLEGIHVYGPSSAITACYFQHTNNQFLYFYIQMSLALVVGIYLTIRIVYRLIRLASSEDFHVRGDEKESFRSYMCRWMLVFNICFLIPFATQQVPDEPVSRAANKEHSLDTQTHDNDLTASLTRNLSESSDSYSSSSPMVAATDQRYGRNSNDTNNSYSRNSNRQRPSGRLRDSSMHSTQSRQSVLGTVMRYHLIRHVIFMLMFIFVFVATLLDAINRKISARETRNKEDIQATLQHRFTKKHPCATAFVAVFAISGIGLLVGLAFLRKPNFFAKGLNSSKANIMISIPEKEDSDDEQLGPNDNRHDDHEHYLYRGPDSSDSDQKQDEFGYPDYDA